MSQIGVQLTDSPYVVVNMRIMARIGLPVFREIDKDMKRVVPCMHSVGAPLAPGQKDVPWPCNSEKYIVHFPETREIWSYGSGYGGNALLGKKCFALRIASNIARDEGWMAEHMLILGVENPEGEKTYVAAAFPSACGKTNFAMMIPPEGFRRLEGLDRWRRHRLDQAGRERPTARHQSRGRLLRRGAGHLAENQSKRHGDALAKHHLHQRRPHAGGRRLVGRPDGRAACRMPRLAGQSLDAGYRERNRRAKPRTRTRASPRRLRNAPPSIRIGKRPNGVPISAIIFGGRRATHYPARLPGLQLERRRLHRRHHGIGNHRRRRRRRGQSAARSHGHAALLRLSHGRLLPPLAEDAARSQRHAQNLPRELVPQGCEGHFIWPGFSQNMRVLQWIVDRARGRVAARETPIGWMPRYEDIDWDGLDFSREAFDRTASLRSRWLA